jgi:hypothetical protein
MTTLHRRPNWRYAEPIVRILVVLINEAIKLIEVFRR